MKLAQIGAISISCLLCHVASAKDCKESDGDETLARLVEHLPSDSRAALKQVNWGAIRSFIQLTDAVPTSFCDSVREFSRKHKSNVSFAVFGEQIPDETRLCMRLAEEISCELSKNCGSARMVPILQKFEDLNQLYPFPDKPDCANLKYLPLLADASSDPKDVDWYREQWRWRTVCVIDGEEVGYVYDHATGWRKHQDD